MIDKQTIETYNAKAQTYVDLVSRDRPDQDLRAFMDAVSAGGHILDWGCGPANSTVFMLDAGFSVDATDGSSEMAAVAKKKFGVDVSIASFQDLDAVAFYDGIYANFSLLHATRADFPTHLAAAHTALKPDGVLHLGLKIGSGEKRDELNRQYAYYQEDELTQYLNDAGLDVIGTRTGEANGLAGGMEPFIIIRARKNS